MRGNRGWDRVEWLAPHSPKETPPSCRGCGVGIPARWTSGLCRTCAPRFCPRCQEEKPPDEVRADGQKRPCRACENARCRRYRSGPGRHCTECREALPGDRKDYLCYGCRRENHESYVEFLQAQIRRGRRCLECESALPVGRNWYRVRCPPCHHRFVKERPKRMQNSKEGRLSAE